MALVVVPVGAVGITPRTGGEKFALRNMMNVNQGSPPHGRGKGGAGALILGQIGITPAWAGKSSGTKGRLTRV